MDDIVSTKTIAALFGVTSRRVEQLKADGIITGSGKPVKYNLTDTVQAYIKYLSDKANGRERTESIDKLTVEKLAAEKNWKESRAGMAKLELDELEGKMHRSEDVEEITTAHIMRVRALLMGMPGKLAVDCANLTTASEEAARITEEVRYILDELASFRYEPDEYKVKVRERQGWDRHETDGDDSAGDDGG